MASVFLAGSAESGPNRYRRLQLALAIALGIWFLLVVSLGMAGAFLGPPGQPPLPIGMAVSLPLLLFWALMRLSPSFREFVLSLDLRLIVGMQAWRWAGFGFLTLYAHKLLPAVFAFPAGLGDMAIGVTAPWLVLALSRQPDFVVSKAFIRWNLLGMLDLVVAVGIGTMSAMLTTGAPGEISTAPMATLPLLLVPAFLVPLFLMLHIVALSQGRQRMRSRA
jgi:hypothetical protein